MPTPAALDAALLRAVDEYVDAPEEQCKAHRAYIGFIGDTEEVGVVVCVPEKQPMTALSTREAIPRTMRVSPDEEVRIKVLAEPVASPALLRWPHGSAVAESITNHRACQTPLVMGGAQIQPAGANWVGTLGCMVQIGSSVAAITNAHVTGLRAAGVTMHQPSYGNRDYFATVERVVPLSLSRSASNTVDLARLDGRSADGVHRITPHQTDIAGRLGKQHIDATLGVRVIKSGRTTGVTKGRCVGIKGVSLVQYDEGTARFVDLDIYKSDSGNFSAAGDSGSAILEDGTNNFVSLLFAGGGGQTLGCASRHVMSALDATMYRGKK